MTYGYIHATTGNNDFQVQHFGILSFASNNRLGPVQFIHEPAPDQRHGAKPILAGMIANFHRGDTLVVTDFPKLGGSTGEVLDALSTLSRQGVRLYVANSGYRLASNADALVVTTAYSLLDMIEKELQVRPKPSPEPVPTPIQMPSDHADLQSPPLRTRKSKLDHRRSEIEELLSSGISLSEAARNLEVSRPALTDWILSRKLSVQTPLVT